MVLRLHQHIIGYTTKNKKTKTTTQEYY